MDDINPHDQLSVLKARAKMLGLSITGNISVETLKARIAKALGDQPNGDEDNDEDEENENLEGAILSAEATEGLGAGGGAEAAAEADRPVDRTAGSAGADAAGAEGSDGSAGGLGDHGGGGAAVDGSGGQGDRHGGVDGVEGNRQGRPQQEEAQGAGGEVVTGGNTTNPAPVEPKKSKAQLEAELREQIITEQTKLVRLRITNLDPKKKDLPGEILSVCNEYMGNIRKYVPYGEQTDEGYHVPWCIYQMMLARKFLQISVKRDRLTGTNQVSQRWVKEFALEVLPPLTEEELAKLGNAQLAAGVFGAEEDI